MGDYSKRIRGNPDCRMMLDSMVVLRVCFCIMRWLPRWRTERKPYYSERTRSLPNRDLDLGYKDIAVVPPAHLGRVRRFKKQRQSFDQVRPSLFNGRTLAGDVEFRTQGDETVVLPLDDGGQALSSLHESSLQQSAGGSPIHSASPVPAHGSRGPAHVVFVADRLGHPLDLGNILLDHDRGCPDSRRINYQLPDEPPPPLSNPPPPPKPPELLPNPKEEASGALGEIEEGPAFSPMWRDSTLARYDSALCSMV